MIGERSAAPSSIICTCGIPKESARTLHFITANLILLFVPIHVFEARISGFWNNLRSMITGRYEIKERVASARTANSTAERTAR